MKTTLIALLPSRPCSQSCDVLALFGSEIMCPRFSALQTTRAPFAFRVPLGLANGVLSFADGNIEYLFGKLTWIAGSFGHEASMP